MSPRVHHETTVRRETGRLRVDHVAAASSGVMKPSGATKPVLTTKRLARPNPATSHHAQPYRIYTRFNTSYFVTMNVPKSGRKSPNPINRPVRTTISFSNSGEMYSGSSTSMT